MNTIQRVRILVTVLTLFGVAGVAQGAVMTFTGDTAGASTFTRPLADLSAPSAVGTNVNYQQFQFNVSTTGDYTFLTTARFDSFSLLYQGSFNPAASLTNAIKASDDLISPPFITSGFASTLTAGTNYVWVTAGFGNTDFGVFSNTIGGPGNVITISSPVPPLTSDIVTITGNTTVGPTFTRPIEDLSALSAVGTNVKYDVLDFTVTANGAYSFLTTAEFDSFSLLYDGAFNPATPLINAIKADDDLLSPPFTTSGFVADLLAGQHYFLVTTGFGDSDFGAFSATIGGPGTLATAQNCGVGAAPPCPTDVPEPAPLALLALGLTGLRFGKRKKT